MNLRSLLASGVLAAVVAIPGLASAQTYYPAAAYYPTQAVQAPPAYYAPQGYAVAPTYQPQRVYYTAPQVGVPVASVPTVYGSPYAAYAPGMPVGMPVVRRDWDGDRGWHREGPVARLGERLAHPFGGWRR